MASAVKVASLQHAGTPSAVRLADDYPATESNSSDAAYYTLSVDSVMDYVERTLPCWNQQRQLNNNNNALGSSDAAAVIISSGVLCSAEEVGDGNLNLVFRLLDAEGVSRAVLKQALPYVRCVGESWPLTVDRNRLEAFALETHHEHDPMHTEKVLFHDSAMAVMVVEDLSSCVIWRQLLLDECQSNNLLYHEHRAVATAMGSYAARVLFATSDFYCCPSADKKHNVQRATNTEMCHITEDLVFTDPYMVHPRNAYEAALEPHVEELLRSDRELRRGVAALKMSFMTHAEAHLHGDLHTGSIFVCPSTATGVAAKAIDAEFGFYGPMGFDVGTLMGNLLLNYLALPSTALAAAQAARLESITSLWETFAAEFLHLAHSQTRDAAFATHSSDFVEHFIREQVWADAVGFAGAEMIRRTIGLAHVADIDGIADVGRRTAVKVRCLQVGAALVKGSRPPVQWPNTEALTSFIIQFVAP